MLRTLHRLISTLVLDPIALGRRWSQLPVFLINMMHYAWRSNGGDLKLRFRNIYPCLDDRGIAAGKAGGHYFFQDLWAAHKVYDLGIRSHVDVGSRLDGFVAHILPFCKVKYVDIRPVPTRILGLEYVCGSLLSLPYPDNSLESLSCLHVLEHIGLGRYGDEIDPRGPVRAASELSRVLAVGGILLMGTPVGRERLCFDAHRIFDPRTVISMFSQLKLEEFALIDDAGSEIINNPCLDRAAMCDYGCGLFMFRKS